MLNQIQIAVGSLVVVLGLVLVGIGPGCGPPF